MPQNGGIGESARAESLVCLFPAEHFSRMTLSAGGTFSKGNVDLVQEAPGGGRQSAPQPFLGCEAAVGTIQQDAALAPRKSEVKITIVPGFCFPSRFVLIVSPQEIVDLNSLGN